MSCSEWKETEVGKIPSHWNIYTVDELVKEKILDRFLDNASKYMIIYSINLSRFYTKLRNPCTAIEYTFAWDCTEEGYDFWKRLNNKYKSIWEMKDSCALLLLSHY